MPKAQIIHFEDEFTKEITSFDIFFESQSSPRGGYSFPCDEEGNILFDDIQPAGAENARKCLAEKMPGYHKGKIRPWHNTINFCQCGSKEIPYDLNDARGIYAGKVCSKCEEEKKSHFRPEIFTNMRYHADEPIEPDDY